MHHAVLAAGIAALAAVRSPVRLLHQLAEGPGIPVLEEIAGPLPAEDVVGGIAPGRALEVALAHQELQEEGRLVEAPAPLRRAEHPREQLVRPLAPQEEELELQPVAPL